MRSSVLAVLMTAGLSVALTGAASAGEPADDDDRRVTIVTCEDGEVVERELTGEEQERLRVRRAGVEGVPAAPSTRLDDVLPRGGVPLRAVPALSGAPGDVSCPIEGRPHTGEPGWSPARPVAPPRG